MLVLACLSSCTRQSDPGPERIVLIVVDTLRADRLGCYGGPAATPFIDELANHGLKHPQAVSAFHQTTMSMASIFTGLTPSIEGAGTAALPWNSKTWCGMRRFARGETDSCVPDRLTTLAEVMADKGYWTVGVVSNGLLFDPMGYSQGFDRWIEVGETKGAKATAAVAQSRSAPQVHRAMLEALDNRPGDRFFMYVHYMDVHDYGLHGSRYDQMVTKVDAAIGDLAMAFIERDLLDGTTFVVTADHGERLGENHALKGRPTHYGNPSFETLLRVPLIVAPAPTVPIGPVFHGIQTRMLIESIAGIETAAGTPIGGDELLLTEIDFRTYRKYPHKVMWRRSDDKVFLFNIQSDPREHRDLSEQRATMVTSFRNRIDVLVDELRADSIAPAPLSDADKDRLRSLGYLDSIDQGESAR